MLLYDFMLQIIYTAVFRVKQLNSESFAFDCLAWKNDGINIIR